MQLEQDSVRLTNEIFAQIANLAKNESGLQLGEEKRMMVQSRLKKRLRETNIDSFRSYVAFVQSDAGSAERRMMISALTTNVSHFFREDHHFTFLTSELGRSLRDKISRRERIRVWSAGCSTGQEPYSIAMHMLSNFPQLKSADFRILATDIDPQVLATAREGRYKEHEVHSIPEALAKQFLQRNDDGAEYVVKPDISELIAFNELNLLRPWPMKHGFDAVFCRNVVIYFDLKTQETLWPRFLNALAPGGILFLGHSERIATPEDFGLSTIGKTTYRALAATH
ncbi:MAG: protein-glutamate O-methyltransferase [Pseudomonadota bacterium]